VQLDRLRPEFRSGLDALTRFVFERTKPKQLGATVMNGPILAGITQSFLDAINNGAVPTISSSWQVSLGIMVIVSSIFILLTCLLITLVNRSWIVCSSFIFEGI